jgi:hypothetical protein
MKKQHVTVTHETLRQSRRDLQVAEYATKPVETARRLVQAEEALIEIETAAERGIHNYSITQEKPEKWVSLGDAVRGVLAPIRDAAREGMKR